MPADPAVRPDRILIDSIGATTGRTTFQILHPFSFVSDGVRASSLAALGVTAGTGLVPTAVKTSAYTAVAGDLIPVDTTSGAVTITLPTAPADGSLVAVKHVIQGSTLAVTVTAAGGAVYNKAGGGTSITLALLNQAITLQYKATGAIWYVVGDSFALTSLDARFAPLAGSTAYAPAGARQAFNNTAVTVAAGTTQLAQTGTMSAARIVTLPAANTYPAGSGFILVDESGSIGTVNTLALTRAGSDTVNGGTNALVVNPYQAALVYSDGVSKWTVIPLPSTNSTQNFLAGLSLVGTLAANGVTAAGFMSSSGTLYMGAVGSVTTLTSQAAGVVLLSNNGLNGFGRLQLGDTTSASPSLKKVGSAVAFRNGDDTADGGITSSTAVFSSTARLGNFTVAGLPSASTSGVGATAFVTDSTTTLALGLGASVTGGGANKVPVYSDGTNWIAG